MVIYFFMIVWVVSFFLLALPYKKAYAWNGKGSFITEGSDYTDVHYSDTKAWCMQEGMRQDYASRVANSCHQVDIIHALNKGWHFNENPPGTEDSRNIFYYQEYSLALECIDSAAACMEKTEPWKCEALTHLGYSLHPLQDKYAHMNAGCGKPDIRIKHGEPGMVNVYNCDGSFREVKNQGDLFDNMDYDFLGDRESCPLEGYWYYLGREGKYINSRWLDTEAATRETIRCFLNYAETRNIYFQ